MAPEYAMEGLFSVKSDVFSFGILLLEIISGKRNTKFYLSNNGLSLPIFVSFLIYSYVSLIKYMKSAFIKNQIHFKFVGMEIMV